MLKQATICLVAIALALIAGPAAAVPTYVVGEWSDPDLIHILDENLVSTFSFLAGSTAPNGMACDGTLIYSGHFTTDEVIAYDMSGVEQFRWSAPALGNLQAMTMVSNELAIFTFQGAGGSRIEFRNPATGALIRSIADASMTSTIEGLAYDGTLLWALGDQLLGYDPADGSLDATLPNAASGETYGGTGLAAGNPGELVIGAADGDWYVVSSADGSVLATGNNGLVMFGLDRIGAAQQEVIPEPCALTLLALGGLGLLARRRRKP